MATETISRTSIVGVFDNRSDAMQAVHDLKQAGFRDDQIGVVSRDSGKDTDLAQAGEGTKAEEGAAIGAVTGAGVGAVWALGIAAGILPAIGPVIAGGLFASILASAAGAAAVGGLVGALVGLGIPEEEAEFYESEVKSGRTIVTVKAGDRMALAEDILRRHHGLGHLSAAGTKATSRSTFANRFSSQSTAMPHNPTLERNELDESAAEACGVPPTAAKANVGSTVDLKKEELHTDKEKRQVGEVRVHKDVVSEKNTVQVPVEREEVVIQRKPVTDEFSTTANVSDFAPGDEIRIPVKEEQVHVEKTPKVVERVEVGKRTQHDTKTVSADVRHEELRVEQEGKAKVEGSDLPRQHPK